MQPVDAMWDVIVVGAGVAGGALATGLARDGRSVLCIERELWAGADTGATGTNRETKWAPVQDFDEDHPALAEPDRIVGELLQPGGYEALTRLGLADALTGIDAQPVYGYGIFMQGRAECIDYAEAGDKAGTAEAGHLAPRIAGRSFHNGRFLRRLRELALAEPNVTLAEGNVVSLDEDATGRVIGISYRRRGSRETVQARGRLTIACDGCMSNLRKRAAPTARPRTYSQFVGLLLDMVDIPFPCHGHVVLADPAPVLFYPVSSSQVRCLVDIPASVRGPVREHMLDVLAPQLPDAFQAGFEAAVRAGRLRTMPNKVMPATPALVPGAILLGDAFNMRHPLTGGGMTVALSDIVIIRELLRAVPSLADEGALRGALDLFYERRKPLSTTINILANALYSVFCATEDPALVEMRDACFDYLASGGRMSHDPMALIGGVKPHPALLVAHFFMVALFGCGRALLPYPTPNRISRSWAIFRAAFNIVKPLIDAEELTPLSWLPFTSL